MGDSWKSMVWLIWHAGRPGLYKFLDLCVVKPWFLVYFSEDKFKEIPDWGNSLSLVELLIKMSIYWQLFAVAFYLPSCGIWGAGRDIQILSKTLVASGLWQSQFKRLHLELCVLLWVPQYQRHINKLERVQQKSPVIGRDCSVLEMENWIFLNLKKNRLRWGNPITVFSYLKMEPGSSKVSSKTKRHSHKLQQELQLDIKTSVFTQ